MRLAIILNSPFLLNDKKYSTNASFINFTNSFLAYFEELIFCVPVSREARKSGNFQVNSVKIKVVELPFLASNFQYFLHLIYHLKATWKTIEKNLPNWDLVWIVEGPQLVPYIAMLLCKSKKKPYFFYIRGNLKRQVAHRRYPLIKKIMAILGTSFLGLLSRLFASNSLTFCLGEELYQAYARKKNADIYQVVPTSIYEKDILKKWKDIPQKVSLVYVGRLENMKGIKFLIEAVKRLEEQDLPIKLKIVGAGPAENDLRKMVSDYNLNDYISFLGYIPYGPDLLKIYRSSDIFVLPTLSEGIPKVLAEAMSQGLPIIASNVGGIPVVVNNRKNGLLVPPGDSEAIYKAIAGLVENKKLLKEISQNNIQDAKEFTIEVQRKRMMDIISAHFPHLGAMQIGNPNR